MKNSYRDNYAQFIQWFPEETENIPVICPDCFRQTTFDLLKLENRCQHCSIIINQEAIEYVQSEN
jgi:uncharacterized CHY-type Zn-finger protein